MGRPGAKGQLWMASLCVHMRPSICAASARAWLRLSRAPAHRRSCASRPVSTDGLGNPWGFGWAAKGFAQSEDKRAARAVPAYLHIQPWKSEPDTRSGEQPEALKGTLTATGLTAGDAYTIYRWDSVEAAFTYEAQYWKVNFTATSDTHVYADDQSFPSDGASYYRVLKV